MPEPTRGAAEYIKTEGFMDNLRLKQLTDGGIDVNDALERFMGNEGLFERFLKKFADDENYEKLKAAVSEGDAETMLTASHTLKGVCGNLSMTELFTLFDHQVKELRAGNTEGAKALMNEIDTAYGRVMKAVNGEN